VRRRFILRTASLDLLSLVGASVIGSWFVFGTLNPYLAGPEPGAVFPLIGLVAIGAIVGSSFLMGMWAGSVPKPSYGRAVMVVASGLVAAALGIVLAREVYWSRAFLLALSVSWLALALTHRFVARRRPWSERIVAVTHEKQLVDHLRDAPHADVVRLVDPTSGGEMDPPDSSETLAVDFKAVLSDRMAAYVSSAIVSGAPVRAFAAVYEEHTGRLPVVHMSEGWELSAPVERRAPWLFGKRIVDVTLVILTAPIWLLVWLVGALVVKASSPGPALFVQERVGLRGKPFRLVKLRTMRADAERHGPRFAAASDDRIFPAGAVMRRFRVDEVPQLWNVLKGDLSLVGPRPEQVPFARGFSGSIPFYDHRHLVRPGVTGWAQVNYGYADGEADTIEKLTYDLYYVKHLSPWLDLQILTRSLGTIASGRGAR
jgi:lipopolysaccharide/colanic/teichoic acid biosynthesis glycosyltransferase